MAVPLALEKVKGLQGLRGVASAFVFLFHLVPACGLARDYPWLGEIARWGFSGVDVFFVLSGFVMWHSTHDVYGSAAARHFLLLRFARIYTGYWPMLAITMTIFAMLAPQTLRDANILGAVLLLEPRDARLIITVAWSLVFELYFYVLFAALLCLHTRHRLVVIGIVIPVLLGGNLTLLNCCESLLSGDASEGYFFLSPFVAEFFMGCLIAAAYHSDFYERKHRLVAIFGMVVSTLGAWLGTADGELPTHQVVRVTSFGLAAVGIVMAVVVMEKYILWPKWLVTLGDRSYALYLGHPVMLSVAALTGILSPTENGNSIAMATLFVICTWIFATWFYLALELPGYRWAKLRINKLHFSKTKPS